MRRLFLTITRECNLRCSYCPTVKDDWPSLSIDDAVAAVHLFAERYGGGDIKLFGGEPMLQPEVVRAVFEASRELDSIHRVYLSTNGTGLDKEWFDYLSNYSKGVLTLSLDGRSEDHRKFRRELPGEEDSYARVMGLLPLVLATPRVVVTQTIPPATATRAAENFEHLASLGFWRFNFLPGYYIPWKEEQLQALHLAFSQIKAFVEERWRQMQRFYVRNLFTFAPTPFFNTGLVVDSDRTIHPTNMGLSGALDDTRELTRCGTLDDPPTAQELEAAAQRAAQLLHDKLPPRVLESTRAVDAALTAFCNSLYPAYSRYRVARKRSAA